MVWHKDGRMELRYTDEFFRSFDVRQWDDTSDVSAFMQFFTLVKDGKLPKQKPLNRDARPKGIYATYPDGTVSYIRVMQGNLLEVALNLMQMGVKDAVLCDAGALDRGLPAAQL